MGENTDLSFETVDDDSELIIYPEEADIGKRLDILIPERLPEHTRSEIQNWIRDKRVYVIPGNSEPVLKRASYKVKEGDTITVDVPEPVELNIKPENIPIDILYEDDDVLIVNKPKGMVVHPAAGHESGTLVNAVMYHCNESLSGINGVLRPGIVHRIDMDTTGSLIICKNDKAHRSIAKQIEKHSANRIYVGIVVGNIKEDSGTVKGTIGRSEKDRKKMAVNPKHGKDAVTHYKVLKRFGDYTYCEFKLETGRTHQIRVHMASIGHPLLGDEVYGKKSKKHPNLQGQTLHARTIGFKHPTTGKYMEFSAPLPDYFKRLLETL